MTQQAQASVIITCYNHAEYVETALRSVFTQTCQALDVVLVNDGSTDDSTAVINAVARNAPLPLEVVHQENQGQAAAWNRGLQIASAPVVFFLDGDDEWYPDKVQAMLDFMHAHPDGGLYQHMLDGDRRPPHRFGDGDIVEGWKSISNPLNIAQYSDQVGVFVPSSGLAVRREVLDKVMPFPERLVTCPDAFLARTSAAFGPVYALPQALGRWRDHDANAGKDPRFGFEEYWVTVVMPAINEWYVTHDVALQFEYAPTSIRGKLRMVYKALHRRMHP